MAERKDDGPGGPTFLRRWSQRKLAARQPVNGTEGPGATDRLRGVDDRKAGGSVPTPDGSI